MSIPKGRVLSLSSSFQGRCMNETDVNEQEIATPTGDEAQGGAQAEVSGSATAAVGTADIEEFDPAALMQAYLDDPSHGYKTLKYGDVIEGVIMRIDRDELLVDIGSKSEGIVPTREFSSLSSDEKSALAIGDSMLVFVVQPENQEGHAVVSIDRARQEKSWRKLQEIFERNEVIEAEVTNYNKGGLLVNLDGVRGFVPASQVSEIRGGDDNAKQAEMARMIGSSLPLKVIEINRHRNRLILSERQAVQDRRDVMKERLIGELKEGEVRQGRVSSICDFGAFVDIGGADGLVHLSELSWSRVRHPGEILKVGQDVEVYVLGINPQEKKIALSIKRTQAEPWSRVAAKYEVGQLVRGAVTQLANFGAFARIEDGIEGLIHVSEIADDRVTHPKQAVKEGQELLLRIIRIDPQRRRMGLSLRRAIDTPDTELVSVFGDTAIEERDRIMAEIRAALEIEGITDVSFSAPAELPAEDEPEPSRSAPAAAPMQARPTAAAVAAAAAAAGGNVAPAEPKKPRKKKDAPSDKPETLPDGEMSAMAMAFAMAGADDLAEDAEKPKPAKPRARKTDDAAAAIADVEPPVADVAAIAEAADAAVPVEVAEAADAVAPAGVAEAPAAEVESEAPAEEAAAPAEAAAADEEAVPPAETEA